MLRGGQLVCDSCETVITRISSAPAEGEWQKMHNLCSACFDRLWTTSIARPA